MFKQHILFQLLVQACHCVSVSDAAGLDVFTDQWVCLLLDKQLHLKNSLRQICFNLCSHLKLSVAILVSPHSWLCYHMLHLLAKILRSYRNVAVIITLRISQLWKRGRWWCNGDSECDWKLCGLTRRHMHQTSHASDVTCIRRHTLVKCHV